MTSSVAAVALTGTIGAGKTTIAEAISEILHEQRKRHALLDLDWLGQVYPVPEGHDPYNYDLALQNLRDVWPNFQAAGAHKAIVAGTLLNKNQRSRLQDALGGIDLYVVLVLAPQETLEARIKARNSGRLLEDFLLRTAQVARNIQAANIHDFVIDNNGGAPTDLAAEILEKLGWL